MSTTALSVTGTPGTGRLFLAKFQSQLVTDREEGITTLWVSGTAGPRRQFADKIAAGGGGEEPTPTPETPETLTRLRSAILALRDAPVKTGIPVLETGAQVDASIPWAKWFMRLGVVIQSMSDAIESLEERLAEVDEEEIN